MALFLAQHVAREPEEEAAEERGNEAACQVAAEQERGPGGERGQERRGDVVGGDRPESERQRREEQREPWYRRRPGEVDAARRPDRVREERVLAVQDRVRPPGKRPDEDLRIGPVPDVLQPRLDQQPQSEVEERDQAVDRERRETRRRPPPDACANAGRGHRASLASDPERGCGALSVAAACGRSAQAGSRLALQQF